jgi:hypothetical protein
MVGVAESIIVASTFRGDYEAFEKAKAKGDVWSESDSDGDRLYYTKERSTVVAVA